MKNVSIHQFGKEQFVNLKKPSLADKKRAESGLEFVSNIKKKPFLLILDEINLAAAIGLLDKKNVLDTIEKFPNVYMTGRRAPNEFIKRADFVNIIECKKSKKLKARKGIEY